MRETEFMIILVKKCSLNTTPHKGNDRSQFQSAPGGANSYSQKRNRQPGSDRSAAYTFKIGQLITSGIQADIVSRGQ